MDDAFDLERFVEAQAPVMEMLKIRLKRLYPMMALGVCLGALTLSFHAPGASAGEAIVKGLLFWPTLTPHHDLFVADSVEWSLMMELGVNVVHAAVLWRLRPRRNVLRGQAWWTPSRLCWVWPCSAGDLRRHCWAWTQCRRSPPRSPGSLLKPSLRIPKFASSPSSS